MVRTDGFTVCRTACEHKSRAGSRMPAEDRKYTTLVLMAEMEQAIPREECLEAVAQFKSAHVCDQPFTSGKALPT